MDKTPENKSVRHNEWSDNTATWLLLCLMCFCLFSLSRFKLSNILRSNRLILWIELWRLFSVYFRFELKFSPPTVYRAGVVFTRARPSICPSVDLYTYPFFASHTPIVYTRHFWTSLPTCTVDRTLYGRVSLLGAEKQNNVNSYCLLFFASNKETRPLLIFMINWWNIGYFCDRLEYSCLMSIHDQCDVKVRQMVH